VTEHAPLKGPGMKLKQGGNSEGAGRNVCDYSGA